MASAIAERTASRAKSADRCLELRGGIAMLSPRDDISGTRRRDG